MKVVLTGQNRSPLFLYYVIQLCATSFTTCDMLLILQLVWYVTNPICAICYEFVLFKIPECIFNLHIFRGWYHFHEGKSSLKYPSGSLFTPNTLNFLNVLHLTNVLLQQGDQIKILHLYGHFLSRKHKKLKCLLIVN